MKLFNTLSLEITAQCNRKCAFCPVAYNSRPPERMDHDLVIKALTELGNLDYRGRLELYIYNEPLKDKEYTVQVLKLARSLAPKCCTMIATNGDYLRGPDDVTSLYDAGLNQLLINCYSPGLYERRLPLLNALPHDIDLMKSVYSYTGPKSRVVQMLDKSNPDKFGTGIFRLVNRAGNIPEFLPEATEPVSRMCVKPFRLLNINWRGEALVCCQDYHGDIAYGNLADSTLEQIWNHPVMNEYRLRLLNKDRSLPLCRGCDCHAGAYPHNVPQPTGKRSGAAAVERLYAERRAARGAGT